MSNKNGSKWIRREKRLAIYLRDGMACAFCGDSIEDGAMLTLDHIVPRELGGTNEANNLITACRQCNSSKGMRDLDEFCGAVAGYLNNGVTGDAIWTGIMQMANDPLDEYLVEAKAIIGRRPKWQAALRLAAKEM